MNRDDILLVLGSLLTGVVAGFFAARRWDRREVKLPARPDPEQFREEGVL